MKGGVNLEFQDYFGRQICIKRNEKVLTQEKLATKIGITARHLSDIENGRVNIKLDLFFKLVYVLEISFDSLLKEYERNYKSQ